jgi:hypothetical protein
LLPVALAQEATPDEAPPASISDIVANPESATNYNLIYGSVVPRDRPYVPLTGKQRSWLWVTGNFNYSISFRALIPAALDQLGHDPSGWQLGAKGYALRAGNRFGRFTIQDAMEITGSAALGYETRYIFSKSESKAARARHALLMNAVTWDKHGHWRPHIPRIASTLGAEYLCNLCSPIRTATLGRSAKALLSSSECPAPSTSSRNSPLSGAASSNTDPRASEAAKKQIFSPRRKVRKGEPNCFLCGLRAFARDCLPVCGHAPNSAAPAAPQP